MFVRVRDRDTKHEYDLPENDRRIGVSVDLVKAKRYPPSPVQRRPKHHLRLAGQPVSRLPVPPGEGVATEKEIHHG
jgi:hypothetical protein